MSLVQLKLGEGASKNNFFVAFVTNFEGRVKRTFEEVLLN